MSAYICSDNLINSVAKYLVDNSKKNLPPGCIDYSSTADELYRINVLSVNYRYNEDTSTEYGNYTEPPTCSDMQSYKNMQCWKYQSCESEECVKSPIYRLVAEEIDSFIRTYCAEHHCFPESSDEYLDCRYDWGWEE